jgi:hypothetical protein
VYKVLQGELINVEFLKVRKIPLTQQLYLDAELEEVELPSALDPGALELLDQIRTQVATDRELADKVSSFPLANKTKQEWRQLTL